MATTTRSYGTISVRPSDFTAHAAALLQQRHNSAATDDATRPLLDSSMKFKDIRKIKREVYDTFPDCSVDWIHRVNAPQMYGMYLLRKEEMRLANGGVDDVQELQLYHVTTVSRAKESLISGLDWRRTRRSRYGCGVSFSNDAEYADRYADNSSSEEKRVIMICSVLVRETHDVNPKLNEGYNLIVPPGTADTTVSPNGCVYVKYYDFDFYPLHLVYYQSHDSDSYHNYRCDTYHFGGSGQIYNFYFN